MSALPLPGSRELLRDMVANEFTRTANDYGRGMPDGHIDLDLNSGPPIAEPMLDGFECWLYQHGLRHMGEIELAHGLVGLGGITS